MVKVLDYTPALRQVCLDMFHSNTPAFFAPAELPLFESWLNDMETRAERHSTARYYFVAELDDVPVACGGFYVSSDGWKARMAWGMVHRNHHRRGIGRDFLQLRIRRIRQLFPFCSIALDTTQYSFGFYEKQGFVVTKVTPDFYAPGMDRYDMELRSDDIL